MSSWIDGVDGLSPAENTPDWFNTANPAAALDPDREFGVDLVNGENPEDSVLEGVSSDFEAVHTSIDDLEGVQQDVLDDIGGAVPDPSTDLTPGWFDWITNNQEKVAAAFVILVALWVLRPYVGMADTATDAAT